MNFVSNQQNKLWIEHTSNEVNKTVLLSNILSSIGYGGFIHNFKNAILRSDIDKLSSAKEQIEATLNSISNYKKKYPSDSDLLNGIQQTLKIYRIKIKEVEKLITNNKKITVIDKKVMVDDSLAIESIDNILMYRNKLASNISSKSQETENYLSVIIWLTYALVIVTLITFFFILYRTTRKNINSLNKQIILFELAPLAILGIDEDGIISSANNAAHQMFNAKENTLLNRSIDELTPDAVREHHQKYREDFQRSDKISPMSERGKKFQARKLNGELFPANISIATYNQDNNKEAIAIIQDMTDYMKYFNDAHTDSLTMLPNRRDIEINFSRAISSSKRQNTQLFIALLDIDLFKNVNDDFGHDYGDQVLKDFAIIIKKSIRESDFVGRWGGEEFLLILENSTDEGAFNICNKIRLSIESFFHKQKASITASIGLTKYIRDEDEEVFFNRVDQALYLSKDNGRNKTTVL